jgi:competence protein ComEC
MNSFRQFPLVRLIVPVFLGIAQGIFYETELKIPLSLTITIFFFFGSLIFIPKSIFPYSFQWIAGILIFLLTMALFNRIMLIGKDNLKNDYIGNFQPVQKYCIGEIIEPVIQKEKSTKIVISVTFIKENGKWIRTVGKALVFIVKSPGTQLLCYGDRLLMYTQFTEPEGSRNPAGFDNKRYLSLRGINLQAHVKTGHWIVLSHQTGNPVFRMALSWRDRMLMLFRKDGMKGREFAVAGALLLGYVDEVDNDLMNDYSATGVMHILSVSGMHVGMIFLVLDKLMAFLDKRKNGGYVKACLVIVFVWLYALITGLSPAVMRAAGMLSLLVTGKAMKRHPNTLNVLAASAIFLLIWQPVLLADPGFQLSYLAVGGIVLLYKPVYDLYVPENIMLDKVWSIVAVSIAAQIATLPLCLYYFHQFPNYFMFTNIIVIPLSNLIIYTGILAIAIGNIPLVSFVVAWILSQMIWFLNSFIHWMGSLPFSVSRGIVINIPEFIVFYSVLISGAIFFSSKNKKWLFVSLSLIILLSGNFLWERYKQVSVSKITVYDVRGPGLFDFITGGQSILVGGLQALKEPFFLDTFRKSRGNEKITGLFEIQYPLPFCTDTPFRYGSMFYKKRNFICFEGKKIVIIDHKIKEKSDPVLNVDYLIISGNPHSELKDILRHFKPGIVIFDASNTPWKVKEWVKEAHWLGVPCYSVSISGAFTDKF